jgi:hypothetical protein
MIRFRRRRNKLPLFERDWQSLKTELRRNMLPKVRIAISELPAGFFPLFWKRESVSVRQIGSCTNL